MKDEKKVNATEEAKKDVKLEEDSEKLTDEEMAQVTGGKSFDDTIQIVVITAR